MTKLSRRYEPDRRNRIIATALDVIAEQGVAGTTHRRIAEAADVPLGSMTYHFASLEEVIAEAFKQLSQEISESFRITLEAARNVEEAREAVVRIICGDVWLTDRNMTLQLELYAYMARHHELKSLVADWMARSRAALETHFDAQTARALDSIIEGTTIHNFARKDLIPIGEVRALIAKVTS
ncbi:TetR family transcriptional regulator [Devosia yakushimensis]|uniref:TetR family transcriptional regulator n=1 Tax=Devosia yakushimensis TaxID=470028 RepID=A0ABQ5UBX5_9HYPH|nr:TetR family transcriptional regulator [Devosia yakushimensis]GLQ09615.1 TetR family transcriptional regulator [Devosia yakushimensis]